MDSKIEKKSFFNSFEINDKESCTKAIKNGGIAAMISATITALFGVAGLFTSSDNEEIKYYLDPWILVDSFLIVVLGFFIFRKSRVAATLMVIYFAGGKLISWYDLGKTTGLLMSLIFFAYYFNAMRGTYVWHSTYNNNTSSA